MIERNLRQVWEQLRAKKPQLERFLEEVRLKDLRGIGDLRVPFAYPVSVLAGQNGCGKSTVLFALACAYKVPHAGVKEFAPSSIFPDFRPSQESLPRDTPGAVRLIYNYLHDGERLGMQWAFNKRGWTRSFQGKKDAQQPERVVSLRRLRNLSNPSEVRSMLQLGRAALQQSDISSELLTFAQQVLPFRYARLLRLSVRRKGGDKEILYAVREDQGRYSEFHMSAGERALLRLSSEISEMRGALVLIDEIEAGLHPYVQQQLMLQLQRLALRNDLQVVVATHSPAVLDAVPPEARLFLDRTASNVELRPAFRDVIQRAFYGRSFDRLSILCEDDAAEAIVRGVLDVLKPRLNLIDEDIDVDHDTGKDEFAGDVRTIARVRRLDAFVFVLDGDARELEGRIEKAAHDERQAVSLVFLPGNASPEEWIWSKLAATPEVYAQAFGVEAGAFRRLLEDIEKLYATAADSDANKAKGRADSLANDLKRTVPEICRTVARREFEVGAADATTLAREIEERILTWRSLKG
jgi:predicted ATPase